MLLDINVLLALTLDTHVHHHVAHRHFANLREFETCGVTEAGLVRLLITEQVVGRKISGSEALAHLRAIRSIRGWGFLRDEVSLGDAPIDTRVLMGRRQVTDLHLVALAASHKATLITFDASLRDSLVPADRKWVEVWSA